MTTQEVDGLLNAIEKPVTAEDLILFGDIQVVKNRNKVEALDAVSRLIKYLKGNNV